jgi:hypothetical protein
MTWAADEVPQNESLQPVPNAAPGAGTTGEVGALQPSDSTESMAHEEECSACDLAVCSPQGRFWLRTDALMWWTNGTRLPALVTSNSSGNPPIIGQTGTQTVFGDGTYMADGRGGVRMTLGGWLDRCHRWGVEADWFTLAGHSIDYSNFSNGDPATGRPFFDVSTGAQNAEIVADGSISGFVGITGGDAFDSAGVLVRYNLCSFEGCDPCGGCGVESGDGCGVGCEISPCFLNYCRTDFLFGFRHYGLNDRVTIHESLDDRTPGVMQHSEIYDNFHTSNNFNGAELGLMTEVRRGRWSFNILTKMALGMNHQLTDIYGTTAFTDLNGVLPPANYPVGIFAGPSNNGSYAQDSFVVIPQLGFELGYQVTTCTRAYLGYNVLYWGNVMRAADQIDLNVDPRNWAQAPVTTGALPFPQYPNRNGNFWAQGINLGLEVRF